MKVTILEASKNSQTIDIPLYSSSVQAGFPSPADDYIEAKIDLNKHVIKRPAATFFARANGSSMMQIGILDGDLMVVDRSVKPEQGAVVIALIDGEMTCKIFDKHRKRLLSANDQFPPIAIADEAELFIEGVVTHSLRYHYVRISWCQQFLCQLRTSL